MWARYRKWKHLAVPVLVIVGLQLMSGDPAETVQWFVGMGIAVLLGGAYVAEEAVWMVQNRGRPCPHCGERLRLKSFSLRNTCPHCGGQL